jgi:hypothetical protein
VNNTCHMLALPEEKKDQLNQSLLSPSNYNSIQIDSADTVEDTKQPRSIFDLDAQPSNYEIIM